MSGQRTVVANVRRRSNMTKDQLIENLKISIAYSREQEAMYFEKRTSHPDFAVWQAMHEWYQGRAEAFDSALEMAEKLEEV